MKKMILMVFLLTSLTFTQSNAQGEFWGMTGSGGTDDLGVIFKTNDSGGDLSVKYSFKISHPGANPALGQLLAVNGKFYGMAGNGGSHNQGVLFEYDPITGNYSTKFDFNSTDGSNPYGSLSIGSNGKLYGMTRLGGASDLGVLFEFDLTTNTYTKKLDFDGATKGSKPVGSLILTNNGKFYGMTTWGGTADSGVLFEFDPATNAFTKKVDFIGATNGKNPQSSLVLDTNGKLFGVTESGGTSDLGVLFEYDPATNNFTKKKDFDGAVSGATPIGSVALHTNGKLYGMTLYGGTSNKGVLFEFNPDNSEYTKKLDFTGTSGLVIGAYPHGSLTLLDNGKFYGMTYSGGVDDLGVLFEYDPSTNSYAKHVDFNGDEKGSNPFGSLSVGNDGKLYGMTVRGSLLNYGVLFEFAPGTNTFSKKFDFNGSIDGIQPNGNVILGSNGNLYGMTYRGGLNNMGVIFEFNPTTNTYKKKLDFSGSLNGSYPSGSLVSANNGKIYGMTNDGGTSNKGVLFEYDPVSGAFHKKLDFDGGNGAYPLGNLVLGTNGKFYGMTTDGGTLNDGVLFEYDVVTSTYRKIYEFTQSDGHYPRGSLCLANNGKLYGMTANGGATGSGVLFEYDLATDLVDKKVDFVNVNANFPLGNLTVASNGKLYGMSNTGGSNDKGTLFEYATDTEVFTKKFDFNVTDGANPYGSLSQSGNGKLYGMTRAGGASDIGILFEYEPSSNIYTKKHDFTGQPAGASPQGDLLFVKANQTITFSALVNNTLGDVPFNLTASASSNLPVSYASSNTDVATISGSTVTIVGAGSTTITASQAGNASYSAAPNVEQTLTVNKLNQTIIFAALAAKSFGDAAFNLAATASSNLAVSFTSSNTSVATISGSTITIVGGGVTIITASQAGNANYNAAPNVEQTLTVNKINQTITFGALTAKSYGDVAFNLTATASSNLAVSYSSSNTSVATISGSTVTIVGGGTTTITALQAGNGNFNAASGVEQVLTINKANQSITFDAITSKTVGDAPFTLTGTATSSLPVSYTASNAKVTISGTQLTVVSAGRATITAAQGGNTNYNAATSVERSFCIKPPTPSISMSNVNTESPTLTSNATAGNQWYLNDIAIAGATNTTLSVTGPGVYKVQAKVDDCASNFSLGQAIVITGDIKTGNSQVKIFPNPASEYITIQLEETPGKKVVSLYQTHGTEMDTQETFGKEVSFNIHSYAAGIYLVKIKVGESTQMMRFVKQ